MKTLVRRSLVAVVATGAAATMAACGSGDSGSSAAGDKKSVYVISCTDETPWCAEYNSTFKEEFEKAGIDVTVLTDPYDPAEQNQHMNQAITAKPDAIVLLASDAAGIVPAVNRAAAAGIPVINTDAPLASDAGLAFSVLADHVAVGEFAAQGIVDGLEKEGKESANIMIASGALSQSPTQDRLTGFKNVLKDHPEYKLVTVQDAQWNQDKATAMAAQVFAQWQSKGGIQAAYGMNDQLALGVVTAAEQAGLKIGVEQDGVVIVGGNCGAPGIPAIKDGRLYTSATQSPGPQAEATAKAVTEFLDGKDQPEVIKLPEYQITQENVADFEAECTF